MKDLLIALAAAAAALATLCALFVSDGDVGKIQEKLRKKGHSIPESLNLARRKLRSRRFVFVVIPSFAAFALSLSAIFVHPSSESGPCKQACSPAQVHSFGR